MSTADLNIRIVQADTVWHDPQANRDYYTALLAGMAPDADIIVLPETFTSGFSNDALAQAEAMDGPTVVWLCEQAMALNAVVTGSVQIRDGAAVFNRMLWAAPDGSIRHYDKRHLFRMAGEHERYAAGTDKIIVEYKGWRICPLVCYDLSVWPASTNATPPAPTRSSSSTKAGVSAPWSAMTCVSRCFHATVSGRRRQTAMITIC